MKGTGELPPWEQRLSEKLASRWYRMGELQPDGTMDNRYQQQHLAEVYGAQHRARSHCREGLAASTPAAVATSSLPKGPAKNLLPAPPDLGTLCLLLCRAQTQQCRAHLFECFTCKLLPVEPRTCTWLVLLPAGAQLSHHHAAGTAVLAVTGPGSRKQTDCT